MQTNKNNLDIVDIRYLHGKRYSETSIIVVRAGHHNFNSTTLVFTKSESYLSALIKQLCIFQILTIKIVFLY